MTRTPVAAPSEAWSALLGQAPTRHRGATFLRAREVALQWCTSGWADQAAALGWTVVELFGVRSWHPFRAAPLRGAALSGWPRVLTSEAVHLRGGHVICRAAFGPEFIPAWCLDRRRHRPARALVQRPSRLRWAPDPTTPMRHQQGDRR